MQTENCLFIFDLDGTLVDSVGQIGFILNSTRAEFGYEVLPQSYYEESLGLPLESLVSDLVITATKKSMLIKKFRENLLTEIKKADNTLFDGVVDTLSLLSKQQVNLAIATSKPTRIAREVYLHSELSEFEIFIQGTDGFPPKPSPDVIHAVLASFEGVKAVMIGDRMEDMAAAVNAGIPSIGIASSAHTQIDLKNAGAQLTFERFLDFGRYLHSNKRLPSYICTEKPSGRLE